MILTVLIACPLVVAFACWLGYQLGQFGPRERHDWVEVAFVTIFGLFACWGIASLIASLVHFIRGAN